MFPQGRVAGNCKAQHARESSVCRTWRALPRPFDMGSAGQFGEGAGESFGARRGLRVFDGGAVATHVDGVHHGECAADAEDEAEEAADRG
jgi:hypothetical protein